MPRPSEECPIPSANNSQTISSDFLDDVNGRLIEWLKQEVTNSEYESSEEDTSSDEEGPENKSHGFFWKDGSPPEEVVYAPLPSRGLKVSRPHGRAGAAAVETRRLRAEGSGVACEPDLLPEGPQEPLEDRTATEWLRPSAGE
ncbi:hypothetical protein H9L39_09562 [Fusarium oxysporum f. sp. albedinis]|nr:hypothetical protein H9L39_09562 [Fusarium oxysporum f. sp. albedinis]